MLEYVSINYKFHAWILHASVACRYVHHGWDRTHDIHDFTPWVCILAMAYTMYAIDSFVAMAQLYATGNLIL
jgi:hypothetical protein